MKYQLFLLGLLYSFMSIGQNIKSPSDFLGYPLGSAFSRHHQVMEYYEYLANSVPDKVKVVNYGKTYENRTLNVVYISSPENITNLEIIRKAQIDAADGVGNASKAIVWLSYNVHGNESVSTEASMQTAYELITQKQDWLKNTIVIIDPCLNPDGRDRYVNWYNQYRNHPYQVDLNSKEHHEPWVTGRPNHYMFDLNRDWVWATQVESQQRLKVYNQWLPHVHVDFHEQGVNSPYYFAPAAEPFHEIISPWQRQFQVTMGENHAKYFDANGWFYFTKEIFDLFYPSYGDTYPTFNGAIGMTYEQGGSGRAGLGVLTHYGDTLTLKDRIAHHHTTGLSTVEVAANNASQLISEFKKFHTNRNYKYKSYVLSGNPDKINALTQLLDLHEITYGFRNSSTVKGYDYKTGKQQSLKLAVPHLVVNTNQRKGGLIKVLFEPKAKLSDSLTYDITAWSLPYAYGLEAIASESSISANAAEIETTTPQTPKEAYAYITDWNSMKDARFLADLLQKNMKVRYSEVPFTIEGKNFDRGSLIITKADHKDDPDFPTKLFDIAKQYQKPMTSSSTGLVDRGKDFGSPSIKMIPHVKVAILSGEGSSTLSFGEVWHFFEQQLQYPVTVIDTDYFSSTDLSKYHVLILPNGRYRNLMEEYNAKKIKDWIRAGGKLIAIGNALSALENDKSFGVTRKKNTASEKEKKPQAYTSGTREYIKNMITGAIFKAKVDVTHPLAFGYGDTYFSLKLSNTAYDFLTAGNVVYIENEKKPYSGFAGSEAQQNIPNSLLFGVENYGRGSVVYLVDNPLFRGFWESGKLFFANAVFMVNNR